MKTTDAGVMLRSMGACPAATEWASGKSPEDAWRTCKRGDWMLWYAAHVCKREDVVLAACSCARLALPYAKGDETEVAICAAEQWALGEGSIDDVRIAAANARAAAAYAAAYAGYAAASAASAAAAADYAADAADAAYAAANAHAAADAGYAAAYAGYAAAAARADMLSRCADMVRRFWPELPTKDMPDE